MCCDLLVADADRVLIGACNPTLRTTPSFRRFTDDEDVDIARAPLEMDQQTTFKPVEYHQDDVLYEARVLSGTVLYVLP